MFLTNHPDRVLKYRNEVITINPSMIEKIAHYADCSVSDVEKAIAAYFPESQPEQKTSIQERIQSKIKEIKQQ